MKTYLQFINENVEFLLDKESEEYQDLFNDYPIVDYTKVDSSLKESASESLDRFKNRIDLWKDIKIVFAKKLGGDLLGRFRSGTSTSTPIILLSIKEILSASKKYNIPIWVTVETTVFHELGHCICELERDIFGYKYLEYGDEEEWVEEFAYQLHEYDQIPNDLETFIEKYKKLK